MATWQLLYIPTFDGFILPTTEDAKRSKRSRKSFSWHNYFSAEKSVSLLSNNKHWEY
ncbi:MAG: hypothetical protein V7L14_26100 [Nostoc sp.]|uniref:hypothetical protein n=1 Tax=Nostoc sp. TaxID=1180 RepID=UPI002FF9E7F7